ncbi:hypothetical protein HYFRA_00007100 [Hymenoscyphus fraxineus]|uniref:Uncharacterized protein n=1 Tax=Hymenoscyphus fraxineus TaxID=746836 RepID=A0A9N9PTD5_9HELO|nr:hypothetical protein HYFRA_00007100 [Hymenoscyphus fraxineus]
MLDELDEVACTHLSEWYQVANGGEAGDEEDETGHGKKILGTTSTALEPLPHSSPSGTPFSIQVRLLGYPHHTSWSLVVQPEMRCDAPALLHCTAYRSVQSFCYTSVGENVNTIHPSWRCSIVEMCRPECPKDSIKIDEWEDCTTVFCPSTESIYLAEDDVELGLRPQAQAVLAIQFQPVHGADQGKAASRSNESQGSCKQHEVPLQVQLTDTPRRMKSGTHEMEILRGNDSIANCAI